VTKSFANLAMIAGVISFLANPFVPYWGLGSAGAILISGGIVARAILDR
jgi:hypothetical protein